MFVKDKLQLTKDFMNHIRSIVKIIQIKGMNIELYDDGIVHLTYLKGETIDIDDKKAELKANLDITNGIKHPFLFSFEPFVTITKEAKEHSIKIELEQPFLAVAVVVENLAYQIMADFYFKFYKPKVAYKVFKTESKAIEWLLSLKKNPELAKSSKSGKIPFFQF